jgi:hypothetical protein
MFHPQKNSTYTIYPFERRRIEQNATNTDILLKETAYLRRTVQLI